jgi:hypothetical protein
MPTASTAIPASAQPMSFSSTAFDSDSGCPNSVAMASSISSRIQTIASSIGSQGMNYVFEATVRYLFRRVTRRARPAITLILKKEMQQAIAANCSTLDLTLHAPPPS